MNEKSKDYLRHLDLSPTSNASDIEEYSEVMAYCLKNDDILNVAVSGTYGSGKSSFLKTYFFKNNKYKTITISLGNYEKGKTKKRKGKENEYYQSIEKSILQQLLYQVDKSKVPLSRFKRIHKYSKVKLFIKSLLVFLFLFILLIIIFPKVISKLGDNFNIIKNSLFFIPNFTLFKLNVNSSLIIAVTLFIIGYIFINYLFYKIVELLKNNVSISKFKFKDTEIEINNKSESIFNKYLDEIVYFFQATNFNVVIIEDLDRFEDATFIIQKLKELNQLINSSSKINNKVKFIFAIKDDFFTEAKERTKFFDKIIPIIPISSYTNSNEIIWEKFEKVFGKKELYGNITKEFIDDVSIFLDDMRIINNIISEFIIYHDKFIKKNLDDKKLFIMIMYKNLYPKEYCELLIGKGTIPDSFKNINNNINKVVKSINDDIEGLKNRKIISMNEQLKSISELKYALVTSLVNYNRSYNEQYFLFNNNIVNIVDFIEDGFDISRVVTEKINFVYNINYPTRTLTEDETFELFGGKNNFINRLETIEKTKENMIQEIQNNIDVNNANIKNIKEKELKELIKEYGIKNFVGSKNELEIFALSRGYITNDYNDYISIFKEGNLTYNDMKFIKSVKKNEKLDYSYHLDNLDEIISRLDPMDFSNINILNNDLLNFIISKDIEYNNEFEKIVSLFTIISDENYDFIEQYESYEGYDYFSHQLIIRSNNLWGYIYKNKVGNEKCINQWILKFLKNKSSLENIDESFRNYINNYKDFFLIYSKEQLLDCFDSLISLNVKFKNLNFNFDDELFDKIYNNNLYDLNIHMITGILNKFNIKFEKVSSKLLTEIYDNKKLEVLKKNVINSFEQFISNCYYKIDKYNNNENTLIEILNDSYATTDTKEIIIQKENIQFEHINLIDKSLHNILIKYDKIDYNLNNVVQLYKESELLTDYIITILNSKKINVKEFKTILDEDIKKKIEYDIATNNKILFDIYKDFIKEFDIIENISDNQLDENRLQILIGNKKVEFNETNFNYIKINYERLIYKFINTNDTEFKNIIETIDIEGLNILTSDEIDSSLKQYLVDNEFINLLNLSENDLYDLLINDIIIINNEKVDSAIINSSINVDNKINYLFKIKERIDVSKLLYYVQLLGMYYSSIATQCKSANVDYNEKFVDILEILKINGIISSYKKGKNNNILVYNKR